MTRIGISTDFIHSADAGSPPASPRSVGHEAPHSPGGGAQALQRTLSGPLEDLRTLRSTLRGPHARVAAPPSPTPPASPPAAQPNAGYWTRLLAGEGIDLFDLSDEEPTHRQAADAPAAGASRAEPVSTEDMLADWTRLFEREGTGLLNVADEEPTTRQAADVPAGDTSRTEPISPEDLLAVARQAQRLPISDAAATCGFSDRFISELLKTDGLTERGLRFAGDKADEITRLMRSRLPTVSARKRPDIDGPRLLAVANSARSMSLRAAAQAHGMGKNIFNYLTLRGLTSTGRNVAGPLADDIDRVMTAPGRTATGPNAAAPLAGPIDRAAATRASRVLPAHMTTPMTPEMLQSIVEAALTQPLNVAAQSVGRTPQQIDAYMAPWGLTHAGRWVAGELADALDEALYQRYLAHGGAGAMLDGLTLPPIAPPAMRDRQLGGTVGPAAQHPRRTVSLELLMAVTQAATSEGTIARACRACGANAATIGNYVGQGGLTVEGRALAGNHAHRIERHMRTVAKRYSLMPQSHPEPSAGDRRAPQPRVPAPEQEPLRNVGVESSSTPPPGPTKRTRQNEQIEQPDQPSAHKQSKPRRKMRRLETLYD